MLTIDDAVKRLGWSRSTVLRKVRAGEIAGEKRHACGALCADPNTCQHGTWQISESAVAALTPSETGR